MSYPCRACDCSATVVYSDECSLNEHQRIDDKRVDISHPEIRTASGHRFASNADRTSILRKKIIDCKK